jgi:UDPglucose 6-dehydrogenase
MNITMIGTGYVGLVSGTCFAEVGHQVICVDKDQGKIDRLLGGEMPIYEPGLDTMVAANVAAGRLSFTTDTAAAVAGADAVFICVGTPPDKQHGHADLQYVYAAAEEVAAGLTGPSVIVNKSTVPVGTGDAVEARVRAITAHDVAIVSNPEFLREGAAIDDFLKPDRIVIGTDDPRARAVMEDIYRPLTDAGHPLMATARRSSELIKYAANAFLATKIGFINEIADLCEAVGGDVRDVALGIGMDDRIGKKFLQAGPGYGGSCFPKDTQALVKTAEDADVTLSIVSAVVDSNARRKRAMGDKVIAAIGGSAAGKRVALLGLTFKANTDDMRDAPAIDIAEVLLAAGAQVTAYDPEGMHVAAPMLPDVAMAENAYAAATGADAVVIVTEWAEFKTLDFARLADVMAGDALVDLRNILDEGAAQASGLRYVPVGRAA